MSQESRGPCPLWGGGIRNSTLGDYDEFDNPRAGGLYRFSRTAQVIYEGKKSPALAAKLTTWIINCHLSGEISPMINDDILTKINARRPLAYSQQIRRFFEYLSHIGFRVGHFLPYAFNADSEKNMAIAAWLECQTDAEVAFMIHHLITDGVAEKDGPNLRLTPEGFRRLELVQSTSRDSLQAFVAMWFDPRMRSVFDAAIEPAILATGYTPMRIDRKEHNNRIDDEILAEIRRSRFVVADVTCGVVEGKDRSYPVHRGGVYFEAGFAMGLAIPVIWTCRKDTLDHLHFDTRQFSHIPWEEPEELKKGLYNRIRGTIGEVANAPGLGNLGDLSVRSKQT